MLVLKSPKDKEIRAKILAKLEQDPDITLQSVSEECLRIINWKHDSARIEETKVQMVIQAVKKMPANDPLQILVTDVIACITE